MAAERHRWPRPVGRRLRQDRRRPDGVQCTVAGRKFFDKRLHRIPGKIRGFEAIAKPAEIVGTTSIVRRRSPCLLGVPIGPIGRNQRAATVWQDHENEEDAAPPDAADHGQRLAFEGVALAGDGQRIWNITVMGSLWPLPSIPLTTDG